MLLINKEIEVQNSMKSDQAESSQELNRFLGRHKANIGSRMINLLRENSNTPYSTLELSLALSQGYCPTCLQKKVLESENAIPMTDAKTLAAARKRANELIQDISNSEALGLDDKTAKTEYEALLLYIRNTTIPGGRIKSFHYATDREYQRLKQAVNRILVKAQAESPFAYAEIKKCLSTGYFCKWVEEAVDVS